jgi:hypothetical protein
VVLSGDPFAHRRAVVERPPVTVVRSMARLVGLSRHTAVLALAALAALHAGACGGARSHPPEPSAGAACTVLPAPSLAADSAIVVLTWAVDPGSVSRPSNPGERFVFEHAYETLIRADCLGQPTPGLAASWTPVAGGARWRLVLRDDARFWSGGVVTAADVIASWRAPERAAAGALARRMADATTLIDDRTLEIALPDSWLIALGSPELAVARRVAGTPWPEGTGAYRVRDPGLASPPGAGSGRVTVALEPVLVAGGPRLTIHSVGATDARDLIDAGTDLLLTEDPSLAAYASARPDVASIPLAWDRTFALLAPKRTPAVTDSVTDPAAVEARTRSLRSALARDAVRLDARAAEGPYWWSDVSHCGTLPTPRRITGNIRPSSRVVFRRDEPAARALAERLVALAGIGRGGARDTSLALLAPELARAGPGVTAAALAPDAFDAALSAGNELAFVVALPRRSLAPCGDAERLLATIPWLGAGSSRLDLAGAVAPLVDTRLRAVVRRDRLGLTATWDSTVTTTRFAPSRGGAPR